MDVNLYVGMCVWVEDPIGAGGIRYPGAGVTGSVSFRWGARN